MPSSLDPISPEAAYRQLQSHPAWIVERNRIRRDLRVASFRDAIAVIGGVAEVADAVDHHPNICIHEGSFVRLELYTHLHNAISQRDVDLALALDGVLEAASPA